MRKAFFGLAILSFALKSYSQQVADLEENVPYSYNGMDYGYYINNASSKEVKGEDYDRYEISLYVSNKNGCLKLIPLRNGAINSNNSGNSNDEVQIAEFNCINATGKRLTAKKGSVNAKPWYSNVKIPDELLKDKYRIINAEIGYAVRNGQTLTTKIIVIVPKGEKPKINCRVIDIPDVQ
ncbi:MAG TPA: hypothetical protein VET23_14090 [Chitinophagaceae bacterium]|nr:hypothetical protein [Chitinophagaceae bacterium]